MYVLDTIFKGCSNSLVFDRQLKGSLLTNPPSSVDLWQQASRFEDLTLCEFTYRVLHTFDRLQNVEMLVGATPQEITIGEAFI